MKNKNRNDSRRCYLVALTCLVFTAVTVKCGVYAKEQQPRLKGSGGKGDRLVGVLFFAYFASHLWMMISFDPTTHVSTGVHQKWSSTCRNSTAYDIMGLVRQDHVCSTGPIDASKHDYAWGQQCVNFSNLKSFIFSKSLKITFNFFKCLLKLLIFL